MQKTSDWNIRFAGGVALTALVAACGGGDDTPEPPTTTALTLNGTATDGSSTAIASRTVDAKCSTGTGTQTTDGSGGFTLSIDAGKFPCVARVTKADGSVLHTVVTGSGTSATANLTPATQLVVANLAGTDPAAYYTAFDATAAGALTGAKVTASQAAVVSTLKPSVDFSGVGDLIGSPVSNAYTSALASLTSALTTAGTTLAAVTASVAASSTTTASGTATTSGTPSLPADLLLKTAASNCAALRSGGYRVVIPFEGPTLADKHGKLVINAATLGVVFTDGSPRGTLVTNGACRYTLDSGKTDVVVSQAGVLAARSTNDAGVTFHPAFLVPEQSHSLADVAGTWNALGLSRNAANTAYTGITYTATFDAAGVIGAVTVCKNDATWSVSGAACVPQAADVNLRANADGGFDLIDKTTGAVGGRGFAYRAGGGELMLLVVDSDGSFQMLTKQRTNALPTVGTVQTFWNLTVNNQLSAAPALNVSSNTIVSLDSTAASWVRSQRSVGGTNDSPHPETLFANNPRNGYTFRAAGTATAADGSTATFGEIDVLGLRGMGLNPLIVPTTKTFVLSVLQP